MNGLPPPADATAPQEVRVPAATLHRFASMAFERAGMVPEEATICASVLVKSSLRGIDTHGIGLLPAYARRMADGRVKAQPHMHLTTSGPSTAILDADNGPGVLAAYRAMETAIRMAEQSGIAAVGVRHSTHFGAGAFYAHMAVHHGMVGVVMSNGPAVMAPYGGRHRALHNTPIAVAIPAGDELPIVMDFAMSVAAMGKIAEAAREGRPIPEGWAIDSAGEPTTDPRRALEGAALPLGHKGYALGIVVDVLAGALTGAGFAATIPENPEAGGSAQNTGHLAIAINVAFFMPVAEFKARVDALIRHLRAVPPLRPEQPVLVPGERGARLQEERTRLGIPVPARLRSKLQDLARELGVPQPDF